MVDDLQTRDRILASSFGLFLERGYEDTSVQAIIDAVGIAKGTFYHHFPSKEAMLVDLVEGMSRRVVDAVGPVAADASLDACAKMLAVSRAALAQKIEDFGPETLVLIRQMRLKSNRLLSESIEAISARWIVPLYSDIVAQGVAEGCFRVLDARLSAQLLVGCILAMNDRIIDLLLAIGRGEPQAVDALVSVYRSIEQAVERLLGATEGSLPIYTGVDARRYLTRLFPGGSP